MLSLRSQMKLIPEVLSYMASEGELGKRQPDSGRKMEGTSQFNYVNIPNQNFVFKTIVCLSRFSKFIQVRLYLVIQLMKPQIVH